MGTRRSRQCSGTAPHVARWSRAIVVLALIAPAALSFADETPSLKNVLVLGGFTDSKAQDDLDPLKSTTRSHVRLPANFYAEYLNSDRFQALGYAKAVSEPLASVYRDKTIVWYRQPTAWGRYQKFVVGGILIILVQAFLIIGLLVQRARTLKSDLGLRESEKRFRLMADTTPVLVWMCNKEGQVTYLNDRRIYFTGLDPATGIGDAWSAYVHPNDLQNLQTAYSLALERREGFTQEYRLRRRDGVYRWMLDIAAPRVNGNGSFVGLIGSAVDITEQKSAREALELIGGKLIEAQEEERSRIARELHDDICQRLALLSLELELATGGSSGSTDMSDRTMEEIRRHCAEIAGDVQALSHRLHSSKLEYLGVVAAISSFCRELAQQHKVKVEFTNYNVPAFLPGDLSLSLFRVIQEALQNALKYSGVEVFSVTLRNASGEIQLEVRDRGAGFDVERAIRDRGLGLVSMQERIHLVHGIFSIESNVGCGTRVFARVPFVEEMNAVERLRAKASEEV